MLAEPDAASIAAQRCNFRGPLLIQMGPNRSKADGDRCAL
jgi:hypothetical protein